jgi:hypothetical protein
MAIYESGGIVMHLRRMPPVFIALGLHISVWALSQFRDGT